MKLFSRHIYRSSLLVILASLLAGCGLLERSTKAPVQAVMTAMPGGKNVHLDPVVLQVELQRYADDCAPRAREEWMNSSRA